MLTFEYDLINLHAVKTIRSIFSYGLVLIFLIPATGFYYTRHSCLKSGEIQLVLDGDHSCCAETSQIAHNPMNQEGSCCDMESSSQANTGSECSLEESSLGCCVNEGNYLKSEDEYTSPGRVEVPHIEIIINAALFSTDLFQNVLESIEENAHSPPYTQSSVDILHKYSVLII